MSAETREGDLEERVRMRAKLLSRVEDIGGPFAARLRRCGLPINLECGNCSRPRRVSSRCNWKCCPVCQYACTAQTASRFAQIAKGCQWPLLVTFNATHKVSDGVLAFREMREAHTRLRAQRWWKRIVKGGVACWEVSRMGKKERKRRKLGRDCGWHFHCHCLLDCKWLHATLLPPRHGASAAEAKARIIAINEELAALWSMAMGGRKGSIDVRRVWKDSNGGIEGAVHEVCKYAMTGAALAESEFDIEPVLWALEKTRMVIGFGSFFRHAGIKRQRGAPAMCECGYACWEFDPQRQPKPWETP